MSSLQFVVPPHQRCCGADSEGGVVLGRHGTKTQTVTNLIQLGCVGQPLGTATIRPESSSGCLAVLVVSTEARPHTVLAAVTGWVVLSGRNRPGSRRTATGRVATAAGRAAACEGQRISDCKISAGSCGSHRITKRNAKGWELERVTARNYLSR